MITTFYPPYNFGGDGIFVQRLSNELVRRGHHVEIIHCADAYTLFQNDATEQTTNDHPDLIVHRLHSSAGPLSPFATQQTGYPLFKHAQLKKILARDFDVIHFHNISLVGGPKILEYGRGLKLYTAHEYWLLCPMHLLLRANETVCDKRECFACALQYKRPPQLWRYTSLLHKSVRSLDALIAPSRYTQELHQAAGLPVRVQHIPNFGIDTFTAEPPAPPPAERYFLYAGRLERVKGLHTILPLFQKRPDLRLWIAGRGAYEQALRAMAADHPNIQFLGFQTEAQLRALYHHAQAVVLPSLWYEVFPLVALEAFQQKTPLLVRNLGALREIVEAGDGGGWAFDNPKELECLLDFVLAHPAERARRGANGFAAYQSAWTAEAHLAQYFELLANLKQNRAARQTL